MCLASRGLDEAGAWFHMVGDGLVSGRENMQRLQEKERVEKEKLQQIMDDADEYKEKHKAKRESNREAKMKENREKEMVGCIVSGIVVGTRRVGWLVGRISLGGGGLFRVAR